MGETEACDQKTKKEEKKTNKICKKEKPQARKILTTGSDDRQSWPILSAHKIGKQKSVVYHAKISRFYRPIFSDRPWRRE